MDNQYELEVNLIDLIPYLLKKGKYIVSSVLLCAVIALVISGFILPTEYTASTRVYVLNRENGSGLSYSDYQIANQMIEDYKVLITGTNVTKEVIRQLELDMTEEDLVKMIQVEAPDNTRVLQISIKDTDPVRAVNIANTVRLVACDQIKRIMDVEAVNLIYEAELPLEPSGPDVLMITLITASVGLILVILYFSVKRMTDDAIRTEEDVAFYLGLSVLGVIPDSETIGSCSDFPVNTEGKKRALFKKKKRTWFRDK